MEAQGANPGMILVVLAAIVAANPPTGQRTPRAPWGETATPPIRADREYFDGVVVILVVAPRRLRRRDRGQHGGARWAG